ncbi:MAG: pseudouridine synthase [Nitrospirota bacterium]|nr:pseudouridine synthase [Nitrospirota bacterium]
MRTHSPHPSERRPQFSPVPSGKTIPSCLERTPLILFHKPKGVLVTRKDERERKTVYHALPPFVLQEGWVPIGRLDKDSRGLLLFTQDGIVVNRLTEPGHFSPDPPAPHHEQILTIDSPCQGMWPQRSKKCDEGA